MFSQNFVVQISTVNYFFKMLSCNTSKFELSVIKLEYILEYKIAELGLKTVIDIL